MKKRTRRTLFIVAAVLVLAAVAIFLRSKAPPEAARLLPEADGIVYVDLKPIRAFYHKQLTPTRHEPEYEQFLSAIGVNPEQDLDQAALALHRMSNPNGPNGPVAYSMVLVGRITGPKLNQWMATHATQQESYAGKTIYSVPSEQRTVRVAQIGYDMLAVSNYPTVEMIHSIIDRHRAAALPFSGSTLLERHYREVPILSVAWGVGQIGLPFNESGAISIFGFRLPIEADSTIIASLHWAGTLHLKVEEIAPSAERAQSQAASLNALIALARNFTVPLGASAANNSLKEALTTAAIEVKRERVILTATLAPGFLTNF